MTASCARFDHLAAGVRVQVASDAGAAPLVHAVHLAAGVRVAVDLTAPDRWHAVSSLEPDTTSGPLLHALIGDVPGATVVSRTPARTVPPSASPWLRLAVVDALDRWLHTPLHQSLVDAERGVARGRAARTLPYGPARAVLTGEALRLARRSSQDLVRSLRRLGRGSRSIPVGLSSALKNVVDGYTELIDDVTGPDRELMAVLDGWRRLVRRSGRTEHSGALDPTSATAPPERPLRGLAHAVHVIDPRQVRARVLALSSDPRSPEIASAASDVPGSVVIRVPAFGRAVDPDVAARLLVRLVDRRTGQPHGHALLRTSPDDAACFEATVPLYGFDPADVRADVTDALVDLPPAGDDADGGLQEARRAVVFLAEWRRLVGLAQLGVVTAGPARRLRRLATRLQSGSRTDTPLFGGGPSADELGALAGLGDDALLARLRGNDATGPGLMTSGPSALLLAEVAALLDPVG